MQVCMKATQVCGVCVSRCALAVCMQECMETIQVCIGYVYAGVNGGWEWMQVCGGYVGGKALCIMEICDCV